jgi:hypothetical protein
MKLCIECYSDRKTDERPVCFEMDGKQHVLEEVLDQWHGRSGLNVVILDKHLFPRDDATFFKVRSDDGNFYVLRHAMSPQDNSWSLESFQQS